MRYGNLLRVGVSVALLTLLTSCGYVVERRTVYVPAPAPSQPEVVYDSYGYFYDGPTVVHVRRHVRLGWVYVDTGYRVPIHYHRRIVMLRHRW